MARLIKADGSEAILRPNAHNMKWTLQELQSAVGGYIQIIRGNSKGRQRMIVEEDGRMNQRPVNLKASALLQQWAIESKIYVTTVKLVGDVLILDPDERM